MKEFLSSFFSAIFKFIKDNIPAVAIAVYNHLQNRIKRKENENLDLQTKLEIEKDKKEHYERTKNMDDADFVDDFIDRNKRS